ncbi:MAG: general secretion pathway protein GspB [Deltaproteobacteria bacterium]|nr:general secretion pathway protein GspB [Deltaproteobacteria bacterium]MCW9050595.1 general secretion pathway protein GspB [Deltaproteobacteria bacterium]
MAKVTILILVFVLAGAPQIFAAQKNQLLDPMRPLNYQRTVPEKSPVKSPADQVNTQAWKLTAVLISETRSVAVINGQSLQEGDLLDGYKLIQIQTDRVVMKNKQNKLVLRRTGTGLRKDIR